MPQYYTPEQFAQVEKFVDEFVEKLSWLKSPGGVDNFADKSTMDDGTICEEAIVSYIIQFAFDQARDTGCTPSEIHDLIASATLRWSQTELFETRDRDKLRPIFAEYLK
jgi:hypothetical protein